MSNVTSDSQNWLVYIQERYPANNASSEISNLDKVKGFILNKEDYPVPLSTFFMPTVQDVEKFIEDTSNGETELYIHLLEKIQQPKLEDLPSEIYEKFFGTNEDKSGLDYKELEEHINNLPLYPSVLLYADVKFIEPEPSAQEVDQ